jgi:hypothetical protein
MALFASAPSYGSMLLLAKTALFLAWTSPTRMSSWLFHLLLSLLVVAPEPSFSNTSCTVAFRFLGCPYRSLVLSLLLAPTVLALYISMNFC